MDTSNIPEKTIGEVEPHTNPDKIESIYQLTGHTDHGITKDRIVKRLNHGLDFYSYSINGNVIALSWFLSNIPRFIDELAISVQPMSRYHWCRDIYVKQEARGNGVFSHFIDRFIRTCTSNDKFYLMSDVYASNKSSIRAHIKYGFKPVAEISFIRCYCWLYRNYNTNNSIYKAYKPDKNFLLMDSTFKHFIDERMA